jgi:hypothetical protein
VFNVPLKAFAPSRCSLPSAQTSELYDNSRALINQIVKTQRL